MRVKQKNRLRKSTKYAYIAVSITIFICALGNLILNLSQGNIVTQTQEIYQYTNKFNYQYKVNLINNRYITDSAIEKNTTAYVTSLIDNIDLNLNYQYMADKESDISYHYSVTGRLQVIYTKNGEEQKIWDEEENILEKENMQSHGNEIKINEKLSLDLRKKNALLNDFKQEMGMAVDATYIVEFKLETVTNIEGKQVINNYTSNVQMNIADKTMKILGDNNKEDKQYISKEYNVDDNYNMLVILIDIICIILAIALFKYTTKSKTANRVKNEFRQELNRILKLCQDKIVQVSTKPTSQEKDIVYVKEFGEIVKVSEELFKPILYYFDTEEEEAWFSVMSGTTIYRYRLTK